MTVIRRTHRGPATPALGTSVTAATSAIALEGSQLVRERRRGTGLVSLVQAASAGAPRAVVCPTTGTSTQIHRPAANTSGAGRWVPFVCSTDRAETISRTLASQTRTLSPDPYVHLGRSDR